MNDTLFRFPASQAARQKMVRWLAEHKIKGPEDLRAFDQPGYCCYGELSAENHDVFLKQTERPI